MDGRMDCVRVRFDEQNRWLAFVRPPICIVCNFNAHSQHIPLPCEGGRLLLASEPGVMGLDGYVNLPAESVAIFKKHD